MIRDEGNERLGLTAECGLDELMLVSPIAELLGIVGEDEDLTELPAQFLGGSKFSVRLEGDETMLKYTAPTFGGTGAIVQAERYMTALKGVVEAMKPLHTQPNFFMLVKWKNLKSMLLTIFRMEPTGLDPEAFQFVFNVGTEAVRMSLEDNGKTRRGPCARRDGAV
jgi:hypothetical protein